MREYEKHGITMPDDTREIIFPEGGPIVTEAQARAPEEGKNIL
ncbi:hypothetical protein [Cellvibrio sp. OA-2007]|nr:hypothetical protein [Cellvibrio sp. OA-2007]